MSRSAPPSAPHPASRMSRQRAFLDFALAALSRRPGKNAALVLVYALSVFLVASVIFFGRALSGEARQVLASAPEMVVQRLELGRHALIPVDYAAPIRAIRGVREVRPRLWGYLFHFASGANLTVMAQPDFPYGPDDVILGAAAARAVLAAPDSASDGEDWVWFRTDRGGSLKLRVAEVLPADTELVSGDAALVSENLFRRLFSVPEGYATDLAVSVRNPAEEQTILEKVLLALPDTRPVLRAEMLRTYDSVFGWRSGYVLVLLSSALLAFFIFAWDKATGLSAEERREIGILKALGWDTGDVLAVKLWEGAAVSLSAFLVGVAGAYVHVFMVRAPLFAHALKGWSVLAPDYALTPRLALPELAALFFLTVVPYTLVTMIPAWRAATQDPDAVMRQV